MNGMNMVDKIFLLVFLLSALIGLFRGGVRETFSLLSWIAGLAVAATFSHPLAAAFSKMSFFNSSGVSAVSGASPGLDASLTSSAGDVSVLMLGVSSLLLFFGTILIGSLIGRMANSMIESGGISIINRLFGGVFGVGRAFLLGLLVIFVLQLTPVGEESSWTDSHIVKAYQPSVKWLDNIVQPGIESLKNKIGPTLDSVGNNLQNEIQNIKTPTRSDQQPDTN